MKKIIILLTVLSIHFISCKKDKALPANETSISLQNATVVLSGKLSCPSEMGTGSVKIYQQGNGECVLGLEQMDLNTSASLVVYLSTSPTLSSSSIKIFSAKNVSGDLYHTLPGDIDFTAFKYLIIQTELSEETIGTAVLS